MPKLILKFKDRLKGEFPIAENKHLTIGRKNANDVVIDNLAVSGNHARIFHHKKGLVLADLDSKNGTFVNKKRVKTYLLKHNDIIKIGKHILIYDESREVPIDPETPPIDDAPQAQEWISSDKTMFMDPSQYKKPREKKVPKPVKKKREAGIKYLSGGSGNLDIDKPVITIGRDSGSDIVIGGNFSIFTGKTAATITKTADNYQLRYISGLSKPKVNKNVIRNYIILHEDDIIEIGSVKLQFYLSAPVAAGPSAA